MTQVAWIFSLARCGSSITAYAGASPWRAPVADEIFGPWDRTCDPYGYPPEQRQLVECFQDSQGRLTPSVIDLANRVIDRLSEASDRIVVKVPHVMIDPAELANAFPDHAVVHLLRNPLWRLNSLYAKGWLDAIEPGYDLERFAAALQRWQQCPNRLRFEELIADPRQYFAHLWTCWRWSYTESDLDRAVAYTQTRYHADSINAVEADSQSLHSAEAWCVPRAASRAYFNDSRVRAFLEQTNAPTQRAAYIRATRLGARPPNMLETRARRLSRVRRVIRANAVSHAWKRHGRTDRPMLLDLATEDGWQMVLCHRAIGSRAAVGIDILLPDPPPSHQLPIGCMLVRGDIQEPPDGVPLASFDLVTALAALDGLEQPARAVQAAADRLRHGGVLVITSPAGFCHRLFSPAEQNTPPSYKDVRAWCRAAGLDLVQHTRFMHVIPLAAAFLGLLVDPDRAIALEIRHKTLPFLRLNRLFVAVKPLPSTKRPRPSPSPTGSIVARI